MVFGTANPTTDEAILIGNIGLSSDDTTNGWSLNPPVTAVTYDNILAALDSNGKIRAVFGNVGGDVANTYGMRGENISSVASNSDDWELSAGDYPYIYLAMYSDQGYSGLTEGYPSSFSLVSNALVGFSSIIAAENDDYAWAQSFESLIINYNKAYGIRALYVESLHDYAYGAGIMEVRAEDDGQVAYGLYIGTVFAPTEYSIYSADSSNTAYFAGGMNIQGAMQFGTYAGGSGSLVGYITIKDAGGTDRKLAVIS